MLLSGMESPDHTGNKHDRELDMGVYMVPFEKLKELNFEDKALSVIKKLYYRENSGCHTGFM